MSIPEPPAPAPPRQLSAWLNSTAKVAGTGISFLLYIALARLMTPEAFADFAVVFAWLALAAALATLSFPMLLVRFVSDNLAQGRFGLARGVAQFSLLVTTGVSVAMALVAALALGSGLITLPRDLGAGALMAAALLVPTVLLVVLAGLLTAVKRAVAAELLVNVSRPALLIAGLGALWFLQRPAFTAPLVLGVYLAASLLIAAICIPYCLATLPRELKLARAEYDTRTWSRTAAGFAAAIFMAAVSDRVDLLLMGAIALPAEVAVYAVAVRFAQTVTVAANAASTAMAPHLVELFPELRAGRREAIQALMRDTARTSLYISLLAVAGFGALGPLFLSLFGEHYEAAYAPLMVLACGQALSALLGPAAGVATLAGAPRIAIVGLSAGVAVNVTLNLLLVPRFGAIGAASATASGMVSAAVITWAWTRVRFRIDTSVFGFSPR